MNRRMTAIAISAVAIFGLTGCTGTLVPAESASSGAGSSSTAPSASATATPNTSEEAADGDDTAAGGQTVAEACAVVTSSVNDAMVGLQNVDAASDPQTSIDALTTASDAIGAAAGEIDNPEVVAAATGLQGTFSQIAGVAKAVLIDGDTSQAEQMGTLTQELQTSVTSFTELCTP